MNESAFIQIIKSYDFRAFILLIELAQRLDESVSIFNAGIGWHESRVPTIATMVPRATWSWAVENLKVRSCVDPLWCNHFICF